MARFFRIVASLFLVAAILYGALSLRPYSVSGDSMLPNLSPGSLSFIDRISPRIVPLRRGEIIVYRDLAQGVKIKRVIGLPGESIQIADGTVFLLQNSTEIPIEERYLEEHMRTCVPGACTDLRKQNYDIPLNHYFVLGDNRTLSRDSRGCRDVADCTNTTPQYIPRDEILGRVIFPW